MTWKCVIGVLVLVMSTIVCCVPVYKTGLYVRSTAKVIYGREKLRKKEKPEQRIKRSEKILDLQSKLAKLRDLLKDINENDLNRKEPKSSTEKPFTTLPSRAAGTRIISEGDMRSEAETKLEDNLKASSVAVGLDALDTNTLKALMEALNTLKSKRAKHEDDVKIISKGRFYEKPFKESALDGQYSREDRLKQIAAELLTDSQQDYDLYDLGKSSEGENGHLYPKPRPGEGEFGSFKNEVLEEVEESLLQDVGAALRNGLTLEDLLNDITKKEEETQYRRLRLLQDKLRRRKQYAAN